MEKNMNTTKNEIHITFSALTKAKLETFVNTPIFLFDYLLDSGDISNIPHSNQDLYTKSNKDINLIKQKINTNLSTLSTYPNSTNVYIWVRTSITNELCNLTYFANKFKKFDNIFFIHLHQGTNIQNYPYKKYAIKASKLELNKFDLIWQTILIENSLIRLSHNNNILSININALNDYILPCINHEFEVASNLINNFITTIKDKLCVNLSLLQACEILRNLIFNNTIISEQTIDLSISNKQFKNIKFKLKNQ